MLRSVVFLLSLALSLVSGTHATQAQELFTDFSGASLDSWSIVGDMIQLVGENTWSAEPNSYRWVYFQAEGVLGQQPEFQIGSETNAFLGDLSAHRFVWSHDQTTWSFFDNNVESGSNFRFSNDAPFLENDVFVAYSTPYSLARTTEHVESLSSRWFVTHTASADRDLVVGEVEELPLYGFRITNPLATESKKKVVLVGGNHSGEHAANYTLEGMLDFLVSDDPRARQMRNVAEFFVYPQVDPLGREEGYYRGNSQNDASDHNRFWNANVTGDNGGFAEIDVLIESMQIDTGGDVDYFLDFHGFFDSGNNFIYTDTAGWQTDFIEELLELEPDMLIDLDDASEPAGVLEFWARTEQGLNADFAFTPELSPNTTADELLTIGESYAVAMYAELGRPPFARDTRQVDTLTRALFAGSEDLNLDLNRDGALDNVDLSFLLDKVLSTTLGDTDLNGRVDFADFLVVSESFGGTGGWGDGDFDGNQRIEFADFLSLSRNFRERAFQPVPEPSMSYVLLASLLVILSERPKTTRRPRRPLPRTPDLRASPNLHRRRY